MCESTPRRECLGQVSCQNVFWPGEWTPKTDTRLGDSTGNFKMARSLSAPPQIFSIDDASADQSRRWLRLGLRLRSVVTRAIALLGHELVEFGPVLGKTQPLQKLLKLALFFLKSAQRVGAIFVESAIAA
jgi:hypothetical protein